MFRLLSFTLAMIGFLTGMEPAHAQRTLKFDSDVCRAGTSAASAYVKESFTKDNQRPKVLICPGFLNELMSGGLSTIAPNLSMYMMDAENVTQSMIGRRNVSTDRQESKETVDGNAEALCSRVKSELGKGHKVSLMCHSKGGAALVAMVLKCPDVYEHPDFVGGLSVQAATGGTVLAEVPSVDSRQRQWREFKSKNPGLLTSATGGVVKVIEELKHDGFNSMTPAESRKRLGQIRDALAKNSKLKDAVQKKLLCVSSSKEPARNSWVVRATGEFIAYAKEGANDGAVAAKDQCIKGIGRHILHIDGADHADLFVPSTAGNVFGLARQCRRNAAVLMWQEMFKSLESDNRADGQIRRLAN